MPSSRVRVAGLCLALPLLCLLVAIPALAKPGMDHRDLMQVRKTKSAVISDDGAWMAFHAFPDRGDGEGVLRETEGRKQFAVERGSAPQLTPDGAWAAFRLDPAFEAQEKAEKDDAPEPGLVLVRSSDGERWEFERVKAFSFSEDGAWLGIHFEKAEPDSNEAAEDAEVPEDESDDEEKEREAGTRLLLLQLADQSRTELEDVADWGIDPSSQWVAWTVQTETGESNALRVRSLRDDTEIAVHQAANGAYPRLAWSETQPRLAFLAGPEEELGEVKELRLHLWDAGARELREVDGVPEGWQLPAENELKWTRDDERLFVGLRPAEPSDEDEGEEASEEADAEAEPFDPYDFDTILEDRGVDVWHWDDPRIKTNERNTWKERSKHLYRAVVHFDEHRLVALADEELPDVRFTESERFALGTSNVPYLQLMTWDGFYEDVYAVDLLSGERTKVVEKVQDTVSISPRGEHVVWFDGGHWHLRDLRSGDTRSLTAGMDVPFADEDHDYPRTAPDYGVGAWLRDDSAVLIYDKYDVWKFPVGDGQPSCLTGGRGREDQRIYRIVDLDPEVDGVENGEDLLLRGYDDRSKNHSFWRSSPAKAELKKLREEDKLFEVVAKAKDADRLIYTEESYTEFPDYWTAELDFRRPRRITEVNPQLADFDLGRAELVEWQSLDGIPLQGILIKPANYEPGKQYPMLVYFYRFFTQRLHQFNDPVVNHRPSYYAYAGDGYAIFLPDIRFEIGRPGLAATKCLVPGVQKVIEMGVADPEAIALHGHSWSGYQTAHIITQTDLFACAVAGAPVSNMTSAYGGIRWGTGLSRQFQYEKSQSRLGVSLWEGRDRYIDNSPLFFADQIDTPLLIEFGDEDDAVPWTQGIELYMAMRRLQKPCVMLQYRGEPHHLKKYPNKLDYSLKMKAFIDHFCKGAPAPDWWTKGVPYEGE